MTWDGFDRQRRWIFPSRTTDGVANAPTATNPGDYEEYGYDLVGNRTSLRKRDGLTLTYQYDALNRMIRKTVPERPTGPQPLSATHTRDVFYDYDFLDLMTDARFDSWTGQGVTNDYDGFGRLASSSINMDGVTRTLTHLYDAAGNRVRLTHPGGTTAFGYAYNAAGRLTDLYEGTGTSVPIGEFDYTYRGLPKTRTGNGAISSYVYDAIGRLSTLTHNLAGTAADQSLGFTRYNPASQVGARTSANDAFASDTAYNVSRPYTANGLNQYTAAGPATFAYDANGNLTSDGSTSFTYDVENRLVAASGARTAALRYDPLGRLYETIGASTIRFLHDGDAMVAQYNTSGTLLRRYVHGSNAGADDPLIWYEGATVSAATRRTLFADHQGSIVAIADSVGTMVAINAYDSWGIPDPTNAGRFQYTGQMWLPELGMYHYKARIYSPTLGRFLQTDPVGYDDQINLYAYVGNDPINLIDATGEWMLPPDSTNPARDWASRQGQAMHDRQRREPIRVVGGTPQERREMRRSVERVLSTPRGQQMRERAESTFQQERVRIVPRGDAGNDLGSPEVGINPRWVDSDGSAVETTEGAQRSSTEAVLGHEFGHVIMGDEDNGRGDMNNVNRNENPIRRALGEAERIRYDQ